MRQFITILFCALSISTLYSQEERIRFRHLDLSDGLSSNSVLSVCQDYMGFMWFGTRYGLNRFDGHDFKVYLMKLDDPGSLGSNHINVVFEDSRNILWIGTAAGINIFDRDRNEFYRYGKDSLNLLNGYVKCIKEDQKGNIWTGSSKLCCIDPISGEVRNFEFDREHLDISPALGVSSLFVDRSDKLWIGTDRGLFTIVDGTLRPLNSLFTEAGYPVPHVRDILQSETGDLWIGSEQNGVYVISHVTHDVRNFLHDEADANSLINDIVREVYQDNHGLFWIGTRYGLSIYDQERGRFSNYSYDANDEGSLSHNSVFDIYSDNENGIWIATYAGGLHYYHRDNNLFMHISQQPDKKNTLSYNRVSFLYKDSEGILWIGTEGRGLNSYNEDEDRYKRYLNSGYEPFTPLDNIKSISEAESGNLWLGTNGGLVKFNKRTGEFRNYLHDPADPGSLSFNTVHSTLVDSRGILWIGTNGGGLERYIPDRDGFQHFLSDKEGGGPLANNINDLIEDSDGNIWIGTINGVCFYKVSTEEFEFPLDSSGILESGLNSQVITLFEDSRERIWIGTEGNGLILFDRHQNTASVLNREMGIPGNIIYSIEEDEFGNIWISTNRGLSRLGHKQLSAKDLSDFVIRNFNLSDGLQDLEFSYRSSLTDRNGRIYFGGTNGYNAFYPGQISDLSDAPTVIFTDFKIKYESVNTGAEDSPLQKDISQTESIKLNYDQREFSITFAGINFINPDNIYYSYLLKGISEQWTNIGTQRSLSFTYLSPGEYDLYVRASDNPGIFSSHASHIAIRVLPPPWRSWWAYLIYSLLIMAVAIGIIFYAFRWFRLKNKYAFEQLSKEKEEELHQLKIRFFTDVSHELRTPLTLILTPLENLISELKISMKFKNQLMMIKRNGLRMLYLVNQLMDLRKFETGHMKLDAARGNLSRFIHESTLPFRELARARDIEFRFTSSETEIEAWFDRNKMEIVINNLLSNAFKATPAKSRIEVRLEAKECDDVPDGYAIIIVEDFGKGIPQDVIDRIFDRFYSERVEGISTGVGLELVRRMVEMHMGKISVSSVEASDGNPGNTRFTILLPLGRKHLNPEQIIEDYHTSEDQSLYKEDLLSTEIEDYRGDDENLPLNRIIDMTKEKPIMVIIEDNVEVCGFIKDLFSEMFRVESAYNGNEGWNVIRKVSPSIIISDIMMPEMDGMELCRLVKSDKRTCHIPVILLTARTAVTYKYEGLETGADDYIHKPFSADYLRHRVKNLILQRKLIQEHFLKSSLFKPEDLTVTSMDEKILLKAVRHIEENIADPKLNVDSLSREIGLSRVHFYRKIKSLTNLTAVEFIRVIRLKRAAQLLEKGSLDISEVRYAVGIQDAEYFRNSFRKQFKMTPREYAEKHALL